jgi:Domain of unknown function (DUF4440)
VGVELTRRHVEAVLARDFDTAATFLHPDFETVTPRGTNRGVAAWRQLIENATAHENLDVEQAKPEFDELDGGDVLARTHQIGRWRGTGEVAFERDFAVRLTREGDRIRRIVAMPTGQAPMPTAE